MWWDQWISLDARPVDATETPYTRPVILTLSLRGEGGNYYCPFLANVDMEEPFND